MTYKKTLIFGLVFLLMIASASATIYQPTNNENDIINPFNTTDLNSDGTDEWFYAYINGSSPGNLNYTNDTDFSMSDGSCVFNTKSGGSSCSTEPDGLVSYWTLDESSGDAIDYISGNDGTPNGGVTQGVTGQVNSAYSFDGSDDYINLGNGLQSIQTFSFWVYPTVSEISALLFQKANEEATHRGIYFHNNNTFVFNSRYSGNN